MTETKRLKKILDSTTVIFFRGEPDGRRWECASMIEPGERYFGFSEPGLLSFEDGRIVALLRTDSGEGKLQIKNREDMPEDTNGNGHWFDGYGYYVFQAESTDNGRSWSEPVKTPIWGHPPFGLRLKSGNLLLLYGHRRPPFCIRAILSRDGGKPGT